MIPLCSPPNKYEWVKFENVRRKVSRADKMGAKMTELRKISLKKSPSVSSPSKFFSRADKGVLKWLSCEKDSLKTSVPTPLKIVSRADKGVLKKLSGEIFV